MKFPINLKPNPHQAKFWGDAYSKLLHLSTGFGGGKTHILCHKALWLSYANKGHAGGLVAPDFKEFRKDILPEMEQILENNKIDYRYHKSEHWFQFPWSDGKLYVISGEKKIRGPNWAYAVINELTLMPLVRYKEVIGRVRVKAAKVPQIASCGTPEGFASEFYEYMIEKPPKNLRVIYGSTDDNLENLHEDYLSMLEDAYDSKMIEAYRRGFWVNMAGNRFYYAYNPMRNDDTSLTKDMGYDYHCSMDFNVDPFCATIWLYNGYALLGVDQIELKGAEGYNTESMIKALTSRGYKPNNTIIYPDPAGRQRSTKGSPDITILERAGYTVRAKAAAPSFRKRQLNVNNLLDKGRIKFNPITCSGIKKDLLAVEQDIVTLEKKKDSPHLTHFSDGLDYMCDILFPFSGDAKATRIERLR